jgi:hypothetical protein
MQKGRHACRKADRRKEDRKAGRLSFRNAERQAGRLSYRQAGWLADCAGRLTARLAVRVDRQAGKVNQATGLTGAAWPAQGAGGFQTGKQKDSTALKTKGEGNNHKPQEKK